MSCCMDLTSPTSPSSFEISPPWEIISLSHSETVFAWLLKVDTWLERSVNQPVKISSRVLLLRPMRVESFTTVAGLAAGVVEAEAVVTEGSVPAAPLLVVPAVVEAADAVDAAGAEVVAAGIAVVAADAAVVGAAASFLVLRSPRARPGPF